ncbi:hypothetical protein GCM10010913_05340 [Paenibacillus aceti]|uniref:KOW domain-containing protein n=1 Tax=Paenibacillus aceti TaxID=1820010 RepID=A0ABQ1VQY2_9BACL|nr:hypothetical protein GCM10010913_05340 [Paenibacillus aceti]
MKVGDKRQFGFQKGNKITHEYGEIISVNRKTMDGIKVVKVRFFNCTKQYSLDHIQHR